MYMVLLSDEVGCGDSKEEARVKKVENYGVQDCFLHEEMI